MIQFGTFLCVDGSGNKDTRQAELKRPIYRVDVASGEISRVLRDEKQGVFEWCKQAIEAKKILCPLLIAADVAIGLPASYSEVYERIQVATFPEWLDSTNHRLATTKEQWRDGLIAPSIESRSHLKPFVSIAKGQSADKAREKRTCDKVTNGESVYCLDHGAKQVGRAALQFWFEVLVPLKARFGDELAIWPFDEIESAKIVVAECYPAECQREVFGRNIKKRNPPEVAKALAGLAQRNKDRGGVPLNTWIHGASSEDEFDMFTTAFAFREAVSEGNQPDSKDLFRYPPTIRECTTVEGWMLGLHRTKPLVSKLKRGSRDSTKTGFVNRNEQENIGLSGNKGAHGPKYVLRCRRPGSDGLPCGHEYETNPQDIFQRKCPKCQAK